MSSKISRWPNSHLGFMRSRSAWRHFRTLYEQCADCASGSNAASPQMCPIARSQRTKVALLDFYLSESCANSKRGSRAPIALRQLRTPLYHSIGIVRRSIWLYRAPHAQGRDARYTNAGGPERSQGCNGLFDVALAHRYLAGIHFPVPVDRLPPSIDRRRVGLPAVRGGRLCHNDTAENRDPFPPQQHAHAVAIAHAL